MKRTIILILFILTNGLLRGETTLSLSTITDRTLVEGTTFQVNLDIQDVTNLWAYRCFVRFDPSVITIVNIEEGPFLLQGGNSTLIWTMRLDNSVGLTGWDPTIQSGNPVSGSGNLAIFTFRVNKRGKSFLHIDIASSYFECTSASYFFMVPYSVVNGSFSNE